MVEQLTPDQPVSGSIPLVLTFLFSFLFSCLFILFPTFIYYSFFIYLRALIAQSVEHGANNARVVGSSPTGSIFYLRLSLCLFFPYSIMPFFFFFYSTGDLAQW